MVLKLLNRSRWMVELLVGTIMYKYALLDVYIIDQNAFH